MYFSKHSCPVCDAVSKGVCKFCLAAFIETEDVWVIPGVTVFDAPFVYDAGVRKAILVAKNSGRIDILRQLGDVLADFVINQSDLAVSPEVVTWVPANKQSAHRRGFDQGKVLAKKVAASLGVPARKTLVRKKDAPQVGKGRQGRLIGPNIEARRQTFKSVLIIDDVVTTGASLQKAASVLSNQGMNVVKAASLAVVP